MARRCIFCDNTNLSQEHIWPRWAAPLLADEGPMPHRVQIQQADRDDIERGWMTDGFSHTTGAVCKGCNNGWMSNLENAAKPLLEGMLRGHGRSLHKAGQQTLATWAVKTGMVASSSMGAARRVASPQEHHYLREHGEPSSNIKVWMAAYTGEHPALAHAHGIDATTDENPTLGDPDRGQRNVWSNTLTIGPVVFQVVGTNLSGLIESFELRHPYTHQIWPFVASFVWRPQPYCNTEQLIVFADSPINSFRQAHGGPPVS